MQQVEGERVETIAGEYPYRHFTSVRRMGARTLPPGTYTALCGAVCVSEGTKVPQTHARPDDCPLCEAVYRAEGS